MNRTTTVDDYLGRLISVYYDPQERYNRVVRVGGGKDWFDSITMIKPKILRKVLRGELSDV